MTHLPVDEEALLAQIPLIPLPPLGNRLNRFNRLIDGTVDKRSFWDPRNKKSWHLQYPEMTQLQLDAFLSAAAKRGERICTTDSALAPGYEMVSADCSQ